MPRNVRNWWIEIELDGRATMVGGPRHKTGGFCLNIKQRDGGGIKTPVRIVGEVLGPEEALELRLTIIGPTKTEVYKTKR